MCAFLVKSTEQNQRDHARQEKAKVGDAQQGEGVASRGVTCRVVGLPSSEEEGVASRGNWVATEFFNRWVEVVSEGNRRPARLKTLPAGEKGLPGKEDGIASRGEGLASRR